MRWTLFLIAALLAPHISSPAATTNRIATLPVASSLSTNDRIVIDSLSGGTKQISIGALRESGLFGAVVDIREFGAVADGVTDNTAAISNAVRVARATGKPLYIPPSGIYLSGLITIPAGSTNLFIMRGEKPFGAKQVAEARSVIRLKPNAGTSLLVAESGAPVDIRGVCFDGNKENNGSTTNALLDLQGTAYDESYLDNTLVINSPGDGIQITRDETRLERTYVLYSVGNGIKYITTTDHQLFYCLIGYNGGDGINAYQWYYSRVTEVDIYQNGGHGIYMEDCRDSRWEKVQPQANFKAGARVSCYDLRMVNCNPLQNNIDSHALGSNPYPSGTYSEVEVFGAGQNVTIIGGVLGESGSKPKMPKYFLDDQRTLGYSQQGLGITMIGVSARTDGAFTTDRWPAHVDRNAVIVGAYAINTGARYSSVPGEQVSVSGGYPYTVPRNSSVGVFSGLGRQVQLPATNSAPDGFEYTIIDGSGTADTNGIVVSVSGGGTVLGAANWTFYEKSGIWTFVKSGGNYAPKSWYNTELIRKSDGSFGFTVKNSPKMVFYSSSDTDTLGVPVEFRSFQSTGSDWNKIKLVRLGGTIGSPAQTPDGVFLGQVVWAGADETGAVTGDQAAIGAITVGVPTSSGNRGSSLLFRTTKQNDLTGTRYRYMSLSDFGGLRVDDKGDAARAGNDYVLQVVSTNRGFGLPEFTTAQRAAFTPTRENVMVWDSDLNSPYVYNGSSWVPVGSSDDVVTVIDSASLQTVIDTVAGYTNSGMYGGTIRIPDRTRILVSQTIKMRDGVSISSLSGRNADRGYPMDKTAPRFVAAPGLRGPIVEFADYTNGVPRNPRMIVLKGLVFDGDLDNQSTNDLQLVGISLRSTLAKNISIEGCAFYNTPGYSIFAIDGFNAGTIRDCFLGNGLFTTVSADLKISDTDITGRTRGSLSAGTPFPPLWLGPFTQKNQFSDIMVYMGPRAEVGYDNSLRRWSISSADASANTLTLATTNGMFDGLPVVWRSGGSLPSGVQTNQLYHVLWSGSSTIQIASSSGYRTRTPIDFGAVSLSSDVLQMGEAAMLYASGGSSVAQNAFSNIRIEDSYGDLIHLDGGHDNAFSNPMLGFSYTNTGRFVKLTRGAQGNTFSGGVAAWNYPNQYGQQPDTIVEIDAESRANRFQGVRMSNASVQTVVDRNVTEPGNVWDYEEPSTMWMRGLDASLRFWDYNSAVTNSMWWNGNSVFWTLNESDPLNTYDWGFDGSNQILEIHGSTAPGVRIQGYNASSAPALTLRNKGGTRASPSQTAAGATLGSLFFAGRDTSADTSARAAITAVTPASGWPSTTDTPAELWFAVTPDGTATRTNLFGIQGDLTSTDTPLMVSIGGATPVRVKRDSSSGALYTGTYSGGGGSTNGVSDGNKGAIGVSGGGTNWQINASVIHSTNLIDGTVSSSDLADSAVTSAKIADGTIATGDIADSAVTGAKIANSTISTNKLDAAAMSALTTDVEAAANFEPLRSTVSQAEAEAGSSTTVRGWTAQRVAQAIAALAPGGGGGGSVGTNGLTGEPIVLQPNLTAAPTNQMVVSNLTAQNLILPAPHSVATGGTGATNAAAALSNLGGQPADTDLSALASAGSTGDSRFVRETNAEMGSITLGGVKRTTWPTAGALEYSVDRVVSLTNLSAHSTFVPVWTNAVPSGETHVLQSDVSYAGQTNRAAYLLRAVLANRGGTGMSYGATTVSSRYTDAFAGAYWTNSGTNLILMVRTPSNEPVSLHAWGMLRRMTNGGTYAGPTAGYLINEDFEGVGIPAGASELSGGATFDYDGTSSPLPGGSTEHLNIDTTAGAGNLLVPLSSDGGEFTVYFAMRRPSVTSTLRRVLNFYDASTNIVAYIQTASGSTGFRIYHGTVSNTVANAYSSLTDVWTHMWASYEKGSGANGYMRLLVATNSAATGTTAEVTISTGTSTADVAFVGIGYSSGALTSTFTYDNLLALAGTNSITAPPQDPGSLGGGGGGGSYDSPELGGSGLPTGNYAILDDDNVFTGATNIFTGEVVVDGALVVDSIEVSDPATTRSNLELATVSQAEAEAGTATTTRAWTAERVKQAIMALAPSGSSEEEGFGDWEWLDIPIHGSDVATALYPLTQTAINGGSATYVGDALPNQSGVYRFRSGVSTAWYSGNRVGGVNYAYILTNTWRVIIDFASGLTTNDVVARLGYHDDTSTNAPQDGVALSITNNMIYGASWDNSVPAVTSTGFPIPSTSFKMQGRIYGTNDFARFEIRTNGVVAWSDTLSGVLPFGSATRSTLIMNTVFGTGNQGTNQTLLFLDRLRYGWKNPQ